VVEGHGLQKWRRNSGIPLICTSSPEVAARLFYTEHFVWNLKTQVGVLSNLDGPPPALSYTWLSDLLDRKPFDLEGFATETQAQGFLRPGVDGDFAGLTVFRHAVWTKLEEHLAEECRRVGAAWEIISEQEFKKTVWLVGREA
jgi:hypothetical protein